MYSVAPNKKNCTHFTRIWGNSYSDAAKLGWLDSAVIVVVICYVFSSNLSFIYFKFSVQSGIAKHPFKSWQVPETRFCKTTFFSLKTLHVLAYLYTTFHTRTHILYILYNKYFIYIVVIINEHNSVRRRT